MPEHINKKLINWASILEDKTRAQAELTSTMPFIYPHVALMPDAHLGKGATVGSVIPTDKAIIPAAVGVDIGCGMMAIRTQYTAEQVREKAQSVGGLDILHADITHRVPLSAGKYNSSITPSAQSRIDKLNALAATTMHSSPSDYAQNWELQLGTLGSGNHFIEVTADELNRVWLFLHSGSRGIGNKIAQHHIQVAKELCERWYINLPDPDLAYLAEDSNEFWHYIYELEWAQEFARLNREEMMDRCIEALAEYMGEQVQQLEQINCHHNYTTKERHFGREVWLSRKGAINAAQGARGLIPGSMGAASYIVTGKGNPLSLNSSPHGAGRNHSRNEAKKRFTRESLNDAMKGISWGKSDAFLDEHPEAYKNIDTVMEDAKDLVHIDHVLHQIVNVKGD